jgi:environmental stress-induced protein Ves
MRIIRASEYRRMPWKNGGGETVEIAISPSDASLDAFDWRVSMAHVASSGPFSRFPGVDRTLAVLAGAGIRLHVAGSDSVSLVRETPPFTFSGDEPASAELIDGPIDDLNAMTRHASHRHRLARIAALTPVRLRREGDILLVMAREAAVTAEIAGRAHRLAAGDTLLLDRPDEARLELTPDAPAELYAIDLERA